MESICPTCQSVIDPTRASVARIRGARVVTFCSAECAEGRPAVEPEPAPKAKAKAKPAAPSAKAVVAQPAKTAAAPARVAPPPAADVVDATPARRRRSRGVIAGAGALLLVGVGVVGFAAWPRAPAVGAEAASTAGNSAPPPPAASASAAAPGAAADKAEPEIDPKRLYDRALGELRQLMASPSPRVQRIAATALSRVSEPHALELLRKLLKTEPSPLVQVQIAYALARAGDDSGRAALVDELHSHQRDVKLDAAKSLVQLGDDAGASQLRGMMGYRHYQIGAAGLLARLGDDDGFKALRKARSGDHATTEIKMRAAVELALAGDHSVRDELVSILEDGRYQVGAAQALAALGDRIAVPQLARQLDIDAFRVPAALALRRLGAEVDLAPLAAALHTKNDVVRVTAGEAILVLCGPAELAERD